MTDQNINNRLLNLLRNPAKVRKLPGMIRDMISKTMRIRRVRSNYALYERSGAAAINGDLPYDCDTVHRQFIEAGLSPVDYRVDVAAYHDYCSRHAERYQPYRMRYEQVFAEKALEHFISLSFAKLSSSSKVIDIAASSSPFPEIVHADADCNVWSNDLAFPPGVHTDGWHTRIGGDAGQLPVKDEFFDLAVLHCALEMFEGDADMRLIRKAGQILRKGGRLVIIPLYMHEQHHILRDPRTDRSPLPAIDPGARLVYRNDYYGIAFSRFYSVTAFMERLITSSSDLDVTVYRVRNSREIHPSCYLDWIAVFEKRNGHV